MTWGIVTLTVVAVGLMCIVAATFIYYGHVIGLIALGLALITIGIGMAMHGPPRDRDRHQF